MKYPDTPNATCDHDRGDLVALVLPRFDADLGRHASRTVGDCPACAEDHDALRSVVGMLDALDRQTHSPQSDPQRAVALLDRVAQARHRRRRAATFASVAASLVVLAVALGALVWQPAPTERSAQLPTAQVVVHDVVGSGAGSGWVSLEQVDRQLHVEVQFHGLAPLPSTQGYEAWLTRTDGSVASIGVLQVTGGEVTQRFTLDAQMQDYVGFWITAEPSPGSGQQRGQTVAAAVWADPDEDYP